MSQDSNQLGQLLQLSGDLDRAVSRARFTTFLVVVFSVVSLGLAGYFLKNVHDRAVTEITPERLSLAAVGEIRDRMPDITARLRERAIADAPRVVDEAERQLLDIPDQFADSLIKRTDEELTKLSPRIEEELYKSLQSALTNARDARKPGESDEQQIKQLIETLVSTYETESLKLIDTIRTRYTKTGGDVLGYLEFLADARDLDRRQLLERQALVTFLTIAHRARTGS
jgi:hypothetical protein